MRFDTSKMLVKLLCSAISQYASQQSVSLIFILNALLISTSVLVTISQAAALQHSVCIFCFP
jgi:hypothetical protein